MKNTSQQYLNSEAHGYLMEAKACKLLLKDLERIRAKLKRHIEKEAADREAEFEAVMQYHSESDIQEAYGWEFISEQQYERSGANAAHAGQHLEAAALLLGGKAIQRNIVFGHVHHSIHRAFPPGGGKAFGCGQGHLHRIAHTSAADDHGIQCFL